MNIHCHFRLSASQQAILIWLKSVGGQASAGECVQRTRGVFGYLNDLRFLRYIDWDDPLRVDTLVTFTDTGLDFLKKEFATAPDDFDQKAQLIIPIFGAKDLAFDKDLVFIVMPFAREFDIVCEAIRAAVMAQCGKVCKRADDLFRSQPIMHTVWEGINKAGIIICDLTGRNANVFYEVGIAHTLGKDVILIAQDCGDIPFDLRSFPNYKYEMSNDGLARLTGFLADSVCQINSCRMATASWLT